LAAGTEVTAEYVLPTDLRDGGGRRLADQVIPAAAALGEPWLTFFSPAEMAALLASCGFAVVEQAGQREQVDTMFWERSDGLHPIELTRLARAVVRVVGQPTEAIDQWGNRPS
jgi:O-methyltransferase involved in polyketide biosynthesis